MNIEELIAAGESALQCRKLKIDLNIEDQSINSDKADIFEHNDCLVSNLMQGQLSEYSSRLPSSSLNQVSNLHALKNCSKPNTSNCDANISMSTIDAFQKSVANLKDVSHKEYEKLLSWSRSNFNSQSNIAKALETKYSFSSPETGLYTGTNNSSNEHSAYLFNPEENGFRFVESDTILPSYASVEQQSESLLHLLKNECASIFSLSLSMSSSLTNANRLMGQLIKSQLLVTKYGESLLQEISSCEQNSKENESYLNLSAGKINILLAEIGNVYNKASEYWDMLESIQEQSTVIWKLTEELLVKNGLKHLVPDIEVKRIGILRLLEEVNLGLLLLSGEAPNQALQIQNDHLNEMTVLREQLEQKIKDLQAEFNKMNDNKIKKINSLQIQLEKMTNDFKELQCQLDLNEKEKVCLEQSYQKQLLNSEKVNENLRHQIINMKQETDKKLSDLLCKDVIKHDLNKDLATEMNSLKNQIKLQDQQIMALEEERKSFWESTRVAEKNFNSEKKKIQCQLKEATDDQISLTNKVKHLEEEIEEREKAKSADELIMQKLKVSLAALKESHAEDIIELQKKIDCKNDDLCESSSKIRSLEVHLMQTNSELELEKQRVLTLSSETDLLSKQIDRLQENMKKVMQFCPRELRITTGLSAPSSLHEQSKVYKLLEESQNREEKLQILLSQKDEQMKELQDSINQEIINKNKELEMLSESVEILESEMKEVASSLNVSSSMYDASQRTKTLLSVRSEQIENLHEKVARLTIGEQTFSEERDLVIEDLQSKLADSKKAVRSAREEARMERLVAAKLRQQLALLKIDLESAQEASRYTTYHTRSSLGNVSNLQIDGGEFSQVNISGQNSSDFAKHYEN